MSKIIQNGERVLIYNFNNPDIKDLKFGTIVSSDLSEPYNYEELPWYERMNADENQGPYFIRLYKILGDDGLEYNCPERSITGEPYFVTIDSRIKEITDNLERKRKILEEVKQEYLTELASLNDEINNKISVNLTLK